MVDNATLRKYFSKLGLSPEIADIYLALHRFGPQNISQLSRSAAVERTRLYRLINQLLDSNLITVETGTKNSLIKAAPIANLNILITQKEQDLRSLQDELSLIQQVLTHNSLTAPGVKIELFQGDERIKQLVWKETAAKTEILCILHRDPATLIGKYSFEQWAKNCNDLGIRFRCIVGEGFTASRQKHNYNIDLKYCDYRSLDDQLFPINHSTFIHDEVTTYLHSQSKQVFGIEITNPDITTNQRFFFETLWDKAKSIS